MDEVEYAGFDDRLIADIVDGLLGFLMSLAGFLAFDKWVFHLDMTALAEGERPVGAFDLAALIWFVFNMTYLVGRTGQSWGRGYMKIKVVDYSGEPIGFWRALFRNLFALFISAPPIYLGFLWIIWDSSKQAWHDKVFRTIVIRADV